MDHKVVKFFAQAMTLGAAGFAFAFAYRSFDGPSSHMEEQLFPNDAKRIYLANNYTYRSISISPDDTVAALLQKIGGDRKHQQAVFRGNDFSKFLELYWAWKDGRLTISYENNETPIFTFNKDFKDEFIRIEGTEILVAIARKTHSTSLDLRMADLFGSGVQTVAILKCPVDGDPGVGCL